MFENWRKMLVTGGLLLPLLLNSCMYLTPEGRKLKRTREQYQATCEKKEAVDVTLRQTWANMPKVKTTVPQKTAPVKSQSRKPTTTSAGGKSVQELKLELEKKQDEQHRLEEEIFSER